MSKIDVEGFRSIRIQHSCVLVPSTSKDVQAMNSLGSKSQKPFRFPAGAAWFFQTWRAIAICLAILLGSEIGAWMATSDSSWSHPDHQASFELPFELYPGFFPECVARVPRFTLGVWGWSCVRSVLSQPSATVRNRLQPFATVRVIAIWPCL